MKMRIIIVLLITVGSTLSAAEPLPDQIKPARQNATVAETSRAILSGAFANIQPDRLALFVVPYTQEIAPCTQTNLIFESKDPEEVSDILKVLGAEEDRHATLSARSSASRKIVLVLFSKGRPISWLVITRGYDAVHVYIEHQFPDGKWVITGGKVVNDIEKWMRQRSLGFDVEAGPLRTAKPNRIQP